MSAPLSASEPSADQSPLAMICGGGSMPLAVADLVAARGRKVILFPLHAAAEGTAVERYPHHWIYVGQIGKFLRLARAEGCRDVVFIGAMVRPTIWQVHPDLVGLMFVAYTLAAFRGGDNHLLSTMGRVLTDRGFRLLGAHEVAPEILMPEGLFAGTQPSERDRADIALGLDYLRAAGPYDVGQAVIVAGKHILAVEAAEGTDQMLERIVQLRANGRVRSAKGTGVLVKAPKPGQDLRFDMPSIGPKTAELVSRAGLAGIAVVAGASIVAEPAQLIATADRAKIFVFGAPAGTGQ